MGKRKRKRERVYFRYKIVGVVVRFAAVNMLCWMIIIIIIKNAIYIIYIYCIVYAKLLIKLGISNFFLRNKITYNCNTKFFSANSLRLYYNYNLLCNLLYRFKKLRFTGC